MIELDTLLFWFFIRTDKLTYIFPLVVYSSVHIFIYLLLYIQYTPIVYSVKRIYRIGGDN